MSCYILNDDKIDFILSFVLLNRYLCSITINGERLPLKNPPCKQTEKTLNIMGNILVKQNIRAYNHRYKEIGENVPVHEYKFKNKWFGGTKAYVLEALRILGQYDYQACETSDYDTTDAGKLINKLRHTFVTMLPDYYEN